MLDSHPEICGGPEFMHIPDIIGLRKKMHKSIALNWITPFCSYEDVDEQISSLMERLLLPLAEKHGCKLLSEKTPGNVLVFCDLINLFPESRCINVVRDPRAIIASMLQVGTRAKEKGVQTAPYTTNLKLAANHTKKCLEAGFKAQSLAPEKVFTVVYERLVQNPESETKRICEFLGVEWCAQMTRPASSKHPGERAITTHSGEIWYDPETYNRDPETIHIDKWKDLFTPGQKIAIARYFRNNEDLATLGYDFHIGDLSRTRYIYGSTCNSFLDVSRKVVSKILSPALRIVGGSR
jgi:protein-tyrosine sulfotransferase